MGPDSLRKEAESLRTDPRGLGVYAGRVRAHADAWEVEVAALRERLAIYERKYGPLLLRRSEESET